MRMHVQNDIFEVLCMYFLVFWVPGYEPCISFGESHFTNGYFICNHI